MNRIGRDTMNKNINSTLYRHTLHFPIFPYLSFISIGHPKGLKGAKCKGLNSDPHIQQNS